MLFQPKSEEVLAAEEDWRKQIQDALDKGPFWSGITWAQNPINMGPSIHWQYNWTFWFEFEVAPGHTVFREKVSPSWMAFIDPSDVL